MVLVAPLVVHPCKAIALVVTLTIIRRLITHVILGTRNKFRRAVFRQIMEQTLKANTGLKAQANHLVSVLGNCYEMLNRMKFHKPNDSIFSKFEQKL